ncbi:MAG: DUF423 domain-containing protein [Bacteroidota bacterium]
MEWSKLLFVFGAVYGLLAVVFGAFGAHALKEKLTPEQLQSFETGVKYQMYHAILMVSLGFSPNMEDEGAIIAICFILGTLLFSFSIYGLVLSASAGRKLKFLGPVTPMGGLLLVVGWALLLFRAL